MAALLSGIVVVFILCHSTKGRYSSIDGSKQFQKPSYWIQFILKMQECMFQNLANTTHLFVKCFPRNLYFKTRWFDKNHQQIFLNGNYGIFCLQIFANTYEAYQVLYYGELLHWPPWAEVLSKWNHFMLTINASINIFIYVVKVRENMFTFHWSTKLVFKDFKFRSALSGICSKFRSSKRNFSARWE